MTGEAGRRQGGDFLPLKRPAKRDAILLTGLFISGLNLIWIVWAEHEELSKPSIEMYTSLMYKLLIAIASLNNLVQCTLLYI
jgi:hypothetical protein